MNERTLLYITRQAPDESHSGASVVNSITHMCMAGP